METARNADAFQKWQRIGKVVTTVLLVALLIAALWFLFETKSGRQFRNNPRELRAELHHFIHRYPLSAPLVYLTIYVTFAVTAILPIWPMQLLAGLGFGLYEGTFISLVGSTIATAISMAVARWIAAEWFHRRVESKMARLKKLDETLGHNGFLFVMTVRLIPLIPFGLFSYTLGLSKVSLMDGVLGTFLGAMPVVALHVSVGAGYHPWHNWRFDAVLTSITSVLLMPLLLRYLRPDWFRKIGVE